MTTAIRAIGYKTPNTSLRPMFIPVNTAPGAMAHLCRDFDKDYSGNNHSVQLVGTPQKTKFGYLCDKFNGLLTTVPDGIDRTLIVVYRQPVNVTPQSYIYPFGNLSQQGTVDGVGIGIRSAQVPTGKNTVSAIVGASVKTDPYLGYAQANAQEPTSALNWQFQALIVNGTGNSAALYIPWQLNELVPATLASGANLANRSIKENGNPSFYRVGAWRDNSTPGVTAAQSKVEVAEVLVFPGALTMAQIDVQYGYSKQFMAAQGQTLL